MLFVKCTPIKSLLITVLTCGFLILTGCEPKVRGESEILIGTIAGPETDLMMVAKNVAESKYHLSIKIITFEDYVIPNTALAEGDIDANLFQHQPYLDIVVSNKNYPITSIAKTFIYPMGIYSKKLTHIESLKPNAKIGIPNDPSNAARALRLLAKANLITVPDLNDIKLTPKSITKNPLNLKFVEMGAAQLPRSLDDLDAAVINTNFALPAGLIPKKDALFLESKDSPYANILVVRTQEKDAEKFKKLIHAIHDPLVVAKAQALFQDQAIKAW